MPLNLLGRLTEVSRTYGCEGEVVRLGVDGSVAWRVVGFWMCRFEALVMIPEGFHFLVEVVARSSLPGLSCRRSWTW